MTIKPQRTSARNSMTIELLHTPARNALPRRTYSDSIYYAWDNEDVKTYPMLPDDTVTTIGKKLAPEFYGKYWSEIAEKIAQAYSISLQELGVTNQAAVPGAQPWLMSKPMPLWAAANPVPPAVGMPIGFDGWTESDFVDRREMFALMEAGQEWTFAQCKWLEIKAEQFEKNDLDQMFPGGVHKWHFYARTHCPRYKAEQPRYIQERDTQDNAS